MMRPAISFLLGVSLSFIPSNSFAQVPVNDAQRTEKETSTAVCMKRARTFKQSALSPTRNIHASMTVGNDTGGIRAVSGADLLGVPLSGSSVGGHDFAVLLQIANTVQAIKTKNVGQAVNALAAIAATIAQNASSLSQQSNTIGTAASIKGAFEQNAITRLSNAQLWNQATEATSMTTLLRNQRLLDLATTASATAKAATYDLSRMTLTGPSRQEGE
ncbi:hypothetical protein BJF93_11335 [Xaviernesmea oryzae]|uniref:Uncharacterized protein n=1 Tax=Xaviernesmea oryzae TaxID=464029 RepID=A0A1Q9AW70_9HYPH|nr:hypothetical protein [Xaviernesmea oryzae]OLP59653.1 hypothetical protein BJF93_11335 [Xaviernesmea oryzae]SEM23874.1 hypothetical protein SAMN04487976_12415 [Xaviernesmea oryzae]